MASRRVSCGANFFNIDWQTFRPRRAPCLRCRPVPFRNRRSGPDVQPMRCGVADKYKLGPIAMAAWADAVYWEGVAGHGPEPTANWLVRAGSARRAGLSLDAWRPLGLPWGSHTEPCMHTRKGAGVSRYPYLLFFYSDALWHACDTLVTRLFFYIDTL